MEEIIWVILEALFEMVGDFFFQLLFEWLAEVLSRWFTGMFFDVDRSAEEPRPLSALVSNVAIGAGFGVLSLLLSPQHLIHKASIRWLNLVLTPLLIGAAMARLGKWHQKAGKRVVSLDKFLYGWAFALAFAIVRFKWCS